jgi:hypothetical protein
LSLGVGSLAMQVSPFLFCVAMPIAAVGVLISFIAMFQGKNLILAILALAMNAFVVYRHFEIMDAFGRIFERLK